MKLNIKLTINRRLTLGFGIIALLVTGAFIIIFFNMTKSSKIANNNLNIISPSTESINELNVLVNESKMQIKNWVFIEKHSNTPDKIRLKDLQDSLYPRLRDELNKLSEDWTWNQGEKELLDSIFKSIENNLFPLQKSIMLSLSSFESYDDPLVMFEVFPLVEQGGDISFTTEQIQNLTGQLYEFLLNKEVEGNNELITSFKTFIRFILFVGIIVILLAITAAYITTRTITAPIDVLKKSLLKKSNGIFIEEEYENRDDEIGEMNEALEMMAINIRKIVLDIQLGANSLSSSSKQINNSAYQISVGANQQASSAEEVSTSMEEMTATISQNTENAQKAEKIARQVSTGVKEINEAVAETNSAMANITEKISVINDIAERIDLLAINAAIEAARAGEHGKGFAVVASEVRNLAESSQQAAGEIDEFSKTSVEVAERSNKLLESIIPHINDTLVMVQEIAASSIEQNTGINQVNGATQQLTQIIQKNSIAAEELSASSHELLSQSEKLLNSISFFKLSEGSKDEAIEEIETQIKKLQELLDKRKTQGNNAEKNKMKNEMQELANLNIVTNSLNESEKDNSEEEITEDQDLTNDNKKEESNTDKGIDLNLTDDNDDDFEKY